MNKLEIANKHLDVLEYIELKVNRAFKDELFSHDYDVIRFYEAMIAHYRAITTNFSLPIPKFLSTNELDLYNTVIEHFKEKDPKEMLVCLKQLLKSVNFWNREHGSTGYLEFISSFFP